MTIVKSIVKWAIGILNILIVGAMIICAYSVYLHPAHYPNWSYLGMMLPFFIVATVVFLLFWLLVKWKYCFISLVGIVICWSSIRAYCPLNLIQGSPKGKTLKVLSYNVLMFDEYNYAEGNTQIVDYITESGADIVCLQEVGGIKKNKLMETLQAAYPYVQIGNPAQPDCAFLSKYPIISQEGVKFGTKSASCYIYDLLVDNDTVKVVNCHLESYHLSDDDKHMYKQIIRHSNPFHESKNIEDMIDVNDSFWWLEGKLSKANSARSLQSDHLDSLIHTFKNKYVILCGDFNDSPISYVHKILTKKLKDAYIESGIGPGWSYHRSGMYFRIDHILISDSFNSFGAKVDNNRQESDHYPIFCTLEMR